jgi:hypothetical protein
MFEKKPETIAPDYKTAAPLCVFCFWPVKNEDLSEHWCPDLIAQTAPDAPREVRPRHMGRHRGMTYALDQAAIGMRLARIDRKDNLILCEGVKRHE